MGKDIFFIVFGSLACVISFYLYRKGKPEWRAWNLLFFYLNLFTSVTHLISLVK